MTLEEAQKLQPGDRVFWTDPEDVCSKLITIRHVKVSGEVVFIQGQDESELECFAHELS